MFLLVCTNLSVFLDVINSKPKQVITYDNVVLPQNIPNSSINLSNDELNSLYNVCGYLLTSIKRTSKTCDVCMSAVGSKKFRKCKFAKLSVFKCYRKQSFFVMTQRLCFLLKWKILFRKFYDIIKNQNINVKEFFLNRIKKLPVEHIPTCHNLKFKIYSIFVTYRLKIAGKKKIKNAIDKYASKSTFCRS